MKKRSKFHIGLRTFKTAVAVVLAMVLVDRFGAPGDRLIYAMLGAWAVMEPTFKGSLTGCLSQVVGVLFGAAFGVLMTAMPVSHLTAVGIGVIAIIVLYNGLRIRLSPSLPCLIMVTLCINDTIQPIPYALGRVWNTAIGLIVGMAINMLIFPYNNSRQIRDIMESLGGDLIAFLEDVFDGDDILPDPKYMEETLAGLQKQLGIFADQKFLLHHSREKRKLEKLWTCDRQAKELVSHLAVLSRMEHPGRLSDENRRKLAACGANIRDDRPLDSVMEVDVVTNYHVREILTIRRALLEALREC